MSESAPGTLLPDDLDLRRYTEVLKRRKNLVVIVLVSVLVLAAAYTVLQTKQYRATADVLLRPSTAEEILGGTADPATASQRAQAVNVETEIEFLKSRSVLDAVTEELGFEPSVRITPVGGPTSESEVVSISATDPNPRRAARAANVYARTYAEIRRSGLTGEYIAAADQLKDQQEGLVKQLAEIEAPLIEIDRRITTAQSPDELTALAAARASIASALAAERDPARDRLDRTRDQIAALELAASSVETGGAQIISPAEVPTQPFSPRPLRNGLLALVLGILLGVAAAFVLEAFDDRVRSLPALERLTNWPVIGVLPASAASRPTAPARSC